MASINGHFIATDFSPLTRDDNAALYRSRLDEERSKSQAKVIDIRPQRVDLERNRAAAAADEAAIRASVSADDMDALNNQPFTYTLSRGQILLKPPPLRRGVIVDTKI